MALGTAGFTAAFAIMRMEHNGLAPKNGPVIVDGATGGVGSVAIAALARLGYEVNRAHRPRNRRGISCAGSAPKR